MTRYDDGRTAPLTVYRITQGLRQRDLADLAGVRPETICRIERGRHRPQPSTAAAIAAALGVSREAIFPEGSYNDERRPDQGAAVQTSTGQGRHDEE